MNGVFMSEVTDRVASLPYFVEKKVEELKNKDAADELTDAVDEAAEQIEDAAEEAAEFVGDAVDEFKPVDDQEDPEA